MNCPSLVNMTLSDVQLPSMVMVDSQRSSSYSDNYGYEYSYNQLIININSTGGSLDTGLWDWTGLDSV